MINSMEGATQKQKDSTKKNFLLPERIIDRVLSCLETKEAIRTSICCKRWYSAWLTCPTLNLGNYNSPIHCTRPLTRLISNTLQRLSIEQLALFLGFIGPFPISYALPSKVFETVTLRELTFHGERVKLSKGVGDKKVMCTLLEKLHLFMVEIDDELFQDIIASCPLIENLSVAACKGLEKGIDVTKLYNLKEFTFWMWKCSIEIGGPEVRYLKLKKLELAGTLPSSTFLNNFAEKFPRLEDLTLGVCKNIKRIDISSPSLKRITLWLTSDAENLGEVIIDAPNMVSFQLPQINAFPDLFLVTASSQCVSKISTCHFNGEGTHHFYKLKGILASLIQSRISLELGSLFNDFRMNVPIFPVVEVEKLHLDTGFRTTLSDSFLDAFFLTCHPKAIILSRNLGNNPSFGSLDGGSQSIAAFLYENLIERRNQYRSTSDDHGNKSWRQELKEVKVDVGDNSHENWYPCHWNSLPWPARREERVRFMLEWEA